MNIVASFQTKCNITSIFDIVGCCVNKRVSSEGWFCAYDWQQQLMSFCIWLLRQRLAAHTPIGSLVMTVVSTDFLIFKNLLYRLAVIASEWCYDSVRGFYILILSFVIVSADRGIAPPAYRSCVSAWRCGIMALPSAALTTRALIKLLICSNWPEKQLKLTVFR